VFSPNGALLAAASTRGQVALHRVPSLARAWAEPPAPPKSQDGAAQELFDADFSADSSQVVFASGRGIRVFATPADGAADSEDGDGPRLVQTIQNPALGGTSTCAFRAARFGRGKKMDGGTSDRLFTVVNAGQTPGAKGKQAKLRKA
jgi:prolactin regulatory element-binding protein